MGQKPDWPPSLAALSEHLKLPFRGDGSIRLEGLASMRSAGQGQLTFCEAGTSIRKVRSARASALITTAELADYAPCATLTSPAPRASFARLTALYDRRPGQEPGIHASAVIAESADLDASVRIGPGAVIGAGVSIAADAVIGPGCIIGENSTLGEGCRLHAGVTLYDGVRMGRNCRIHSGTVIGADGFGFEPSSEGYIKFHQLGAVVIGDDFECGAMVTIDRGALDDTVIGRGVKLDDHVHIGHNVEVGDHTAMAGFVGIGGGVRIGSWCAIGGGVIIVGHLDIADRVFVEATSLVARSVRVPGTRISSVWPAEPVRQWRTRQLQLAGKLRGEE